MQALNDQQWLRQYLGRLLQYQCNTHASLCDPQWTLQPTGACRATLKSWLIHSSLHGRRVGQGYLTSEAAGTLEEALLAYALLQDF